VLIDTSTLLRTIQPAHPQRDIARNAIKRLADRGTELHLVPQNLFELWVVVTRPVAQNGLGFSVAEAASELMRLKSMFLVLPDTPAILFRLGKPDHSASGDRQTCARCSTRCRDAGPWPYEHPDIRQRRIFALPGIEVVHPADVVR
jgi:hypothetical protein